jgi:hypothetical protein
MSSVSLGGFPGTDGAVRRCQPQVPSRRGKVRSVQLIFIASNPLSQASHHACGLFALGANRACTPGSTTLIHLIASDARVFATLVATSLAHYFRFRRKFNTNFRH